ncbi:RidA family protein [Bradyrhizobium sp. AZCC 2230]|uniref:RidA family protein n=1 Tax=Bradyrhizobium sp. AZCC 2230 TaxID=3117021 RepID=UPI002FF2CACD
MTSRSRTYGALPAPFGKFAHATVLPIAGTKLVFVSGVTARESGAVDAEAQTRVIYERIRTVLEEEGGGFQHVLKMNVFVLDIADYPATNRIREEFFAGLDAPASTLVEVSGFVRPDVRVEIECTAAIPQN